MNSLTPTSKIPTQNLGEVLPQHTALLVASGIAADIARERGYRSVMKRSELRRLGFSDSQLRVPALLIPIWGVAGELVTYQIRPDEPRILNGKPLKYETPAGTRMVLDVPRRVRLWLGDPKRPLFITEGARKADSAVSRDLCCVAVLGVWSWRGTNEQGGKVALPDWESVALNGRTVYIAFDSDVMLKPEVHAALARLKSFLESRGARVLVIYLPAAPGGTKVGLDDFLAAGHSIEELLGLSSPDLRPAIAPGGVEQSHAARDTRTAELREKAASVLAAADPLDLVRRAIGAMGYGGDPGPALITYLAATSRLLKMRQGAMPVHLLLLGLPSTGKSYALRTVLNLLPQEVYYEIDAGSPRVLIYGDADVQHRVVIFGEADSLPAGEDNPAASAVRNLLQEHQLRYQVTVRDPESGNFRVREVLKPGPSVLITSAVRRLGAQLDSRLFTLEVPDDAEQVRKALETQAVIELDGCAAPDQALIAFQAYLQQMVPWDVSVPFARELSRAIGQPGATSRILRDFSRLLSLIKTVTVLRHRRRTRDSAGRWIAEVDDYAAVFELVGDMYEASASGASIAVRDVVKAVRTLKHEAPEEPVRIITVAERLGVNKMAASRRVAAALKEGWLLNLEQRDRYPANLVLGEPIPERTGLPEPAFLMAGNTVTALTDLGVAVEEGVL